MEAAISSSLSHPNIVQTYTYTIRPMRDTTQQQQQLTSSGTHLALCHVCQQTLVQHVGLCTLLLQQLWWQSLQLTGSAALCWSGSGTMQPTAVHLRPQSGRRQYVMGRFHRNLPSQPCCWACVRRCCCTPPTSNLLLPTLSLC
jgi:hypothetical protein